MQIPRQRSSDAVIEEIVELCRLGFRFIALADDNFYPVTLSDLRLAAQQQNSTRLHELESMRVERFDVKGGMKGDQWAGGKGNQ